MKTLITKTAPSWSFLMLLVTVDKSSEFDWICVDQRLDLVFESRAILRRMPSKSSMVLTSGINIISFRIWRSSWSCENDRNPIVLNQYGEQFSIRHRKCMVHFDPFPFLALVIAWVGPITIFPCRHLGRKTSNWGYLGTWSTWVKEVPDRFFHWLEFSSAWFFNRFIGDVPFRGCPSVHDSSTLYSISILPTEYIKSPNSTKVLTISMS